MDYIMLLVVEEVSVLLQAKCHCASVVCVEGCGVGSIHVYLSLPTVYTAVYDKL